MKHAKRKISSLLLFLMLTACGREVVKYDLWIHPSLKPSVVEFFRDVERFDMRGAIGGIEVITISDLPGKYAGFCYAYRDAVYIDQSLKGYDLKSSVYHELTHCVFGIYDHNPDPESIFAEYLPDINEDNWTDKKIDLFHYIRQHSPYERAVREL